MRITGVAALLFGFWLLKIQWEFDEVKIGVLTTGLVFMFIGGYLVLASPSSEKKKKRGELLEKAGKILAELKERNDEEEFLDKAPSGTIISSDRDTVTYVGERRGKKEVVTRNKPRYMK